MAWSKRAWEPAVRADASRVSSVRGRQGSAACMHQKAIGGMPSHEQSPAPALRSALSALLRVGRVGNQSPDSHASATRPPHTPCSTAAATCAAPSSPRLIRVLPDRAQAPPRVGSRWLWTAMRVTSTLLRVWPWETAAPRPRLPSLLAPGLSRPLRTILAGLSSLQAFRGHSPRCWLHAVALSSGASPRSIARVASRLGMRWCDAQVCEHAVQRACGGVSFVGADIAERREDWRMARCRRRESHILQTCSL